MKEYMQHENYQHNKDWLCCVDNSCVAFHSENSVLQESCYFVTKNFCALSYFFGKSHFLLAQVHSENRAFPYEQVLLVIGCMV